MFELLKRSKKFPVLFVTAPRSGHHLLQRSLWQNHPHKYCEYYSTPRRDCCEKIPCKRLGVELQKSHDFDAKTPKSSKLRYVIQVRRIYPSIISHFQLDVASGNIEDSRASWIERAQFLTKRRKQFFDKWLVDFDLNGVVVHYDDLIGQPQKTVSRVHKFVWGRELLSPEIEPINPARNVENFKYHDPDFVQELDIEHYDALVDGFRKDS